MIKSFNEKIYLVASPDVKHAIDKGVFSNAIEHLEKFGLREIENGERQFHIDFKPFDEKKYLEHFSDIEKHIKDGNFSNPFDHFCQHGYNEIINGIRQWDKVDTNQKTISNIIIESKDKGIDENNIDNFDFDFYVNYYSDLNKVIHTQEQALNHYLQYGYKEKRFKNFRELYLSKSIDLKDLSEYLKDVSIQVINKLNTIEVSYQSLSDGLTGQYFYPIKISNDKKTNADFYLALAESFLIKKDVSTADNYLNLSLHFMENIKALEYKGNINLDNKDYQDAIIYYEESFSLGNRSKYIFENLIKCYENLSGYDKVTYYSLLGIKEFYTDKQIFVEKLDSTMMLLLMKNKYKSINEYLVKPDRKQFLNDTNEYVHSIYQTYYDLYGAKEIVENYNSLNSQNVLIIGDFHIDQCIRYRIDQKVEQFRSQGIGTETIDWTQLDAHKNIIPFYDIVIFYRVPATLPIIKTIAQVNALNKVSLYEIDDLIFDTIYPDNIETYGGNVDLSSYNSLVFGMAEMNSIAKLCQFGIASTVPLQKRLKKLVSKKKCILHRNGLDQHNVFSEPNKINKKTIDIFYGSGTLAHNEDFITLALPAIKQIMLEYDQARLVVAGHLTLPKQFQDAFKERVLTLPKVNIDAYYGYLKQADINLAVLYKDEITDCKSELKWFEAACFSIPSIVSPTQNYLDVIKNEEDGFIAHDTAEWYTSLKKLVENPDLRYEIGSKALQRIQKEYDIDTLGSSLVNEINLLIDSSSHKKRKKIALVNVFFPPQSIGGATRVVADNFDLFIDKYADDYEICVFTAEADRLNPYEQSMYTHKGARVYKSNILFREHMDWHPKDEKMYEIFTKFLKNEKPDKVHFHCVQRLTASIVEATRDLNIPYVITAHDAWWISDHQFLVDHNETVYPDGHPDTFAARVLPANITLDMSIEREMYLKSLLNEAQHVLTVSESFANIYRKNGVPDIKVTKNGISSQIEWLPKDTKYTDKVVCGHIGGMSAHKGYDILKNAVLNLQPENVQFLIVDHSKDMHYVSNEKWGDVDVKFIGRQKQEEMVQLYGHIDVLFAPSIWPESFGLVTREALACGCWIVASSLGGIGEDVAHEVNGFVLEPTQKNLEKTLKVISNDYKKYKTLAKSDDIYTVDKQVEELRRYIND